MDSLFYPSSQQHSAHMMDDDDLLFDTIKPQPQHQQLLQQEEDDFDFTDSEPDSIPMSQCSSLNSSFCVEDALSIDYNSSPSYDISSSPSYSPSTAAQSDYNYGFDIPAPESLDFTLDQQGSFIQEIENQALDSLHYTTDPESQAAMLPSAIQRYYNPETGQILFPETNDQLTQLLDELIRSQIDVSQLQYRWRANKPSNAITLAHLYNTIKCGLFTKDTIICIILSTDDEAIFGNFHEDQFVQLLQSCQICMSIEARVNKPIGKSFLKNAVHIRHHTIEVAMSLCGTILEQSVYTMVDLFSSMPNLHFYLYLTDPRKTSLVKTVSDATGCSVPARHHGFWSKIAKFQNILVIFVFDQESNQSLSDLSSVKTRRGASQGNYLFAYVMPTLENSIVHLTVHLDQAGDIVDGSVSKEWLRFFESKEFMSGYKRLAEVNLEGANDQICQALLMRKLAQLCK